MTAPPFPLPTSRSTTPAGPEQGPVEGRQHLAALVALVVGGLGQLVRDTDDADGPRAGEGEADAPSAGHVDDVGVVDAADRYRQRAAAHASGGHASRRWHKSAAPCSGRRRPGRRTRRRRHRSGPPGRALAGMAAPVKSRPVTVGAAHRHGRRRRAEREARAAGGQR